MGYRTLQGAAVDEDGAVGEFRIISEKSAELPLHPPRTPYEVTRD
jgi:hypothetical protein